MSPTSHTYLEVAFTNPTAVAATVSLGIRRTAGWQELRTIVLAPHTNQKFRVAAEVLNRLELPGADAVTLLKAEYSLSSTEIVSAAWLADDSTGFSNTALFNDEYPGTNTLFGTQLLSGSFPANVLPKGPSFASYLVFVNVNNAPVDISGILFCDDGTGSRPTPLPSIHLLPYSPYVFSVEGALHGTPKPKSAVCSGTFQYTGAPGHVIGRFYGEAEGAAYGMYAKLEPYVTHAYNEVYWSTQDGFMPILTITNFSSQDDTVTIFTSTSGQLRQLTSQQLSGHDSLTLNLRDHLNALQSTSSSNAAYGGLYVSSSRLDGKLMVKQQALSLQEHLMVPYYGIPNYITGYYIDPFPPSSMSVGQSVNENQITCFSASGCVYDFYPILSSNPSVLSVTSSGSQQSLNAQTQGQAQIRVPPACCDFLGSDVGYDPNQVQVAGPLCFAQLKYRPVNISGFTGFNHCFWWIQDSNARQWVTDAGPSGQCPLNCGYLINWVMPGSVGFYKEDNPSASLAWSTGLSSAVCSGVTNLYNYAVNWPQTTYKYGFFNSNTFAHVAGDAAPFSPTPPAFAVGW